MEKKEEQKMNNSDEIMQQDKNNRDEIVQQEKNNSDEIVQQEKNNSDEIVQQEKEMDLNKSNEDVSEKTFQEVAENKEEIAEKNSANDLLKKENIAEQTPKVEYLTLENEILTNEQDIEYYKFLQNFEVLKNRLLGSFDEKGKYTLSEDVCKELVKLIKVTEDTVDNVVYATANCDKDKLKFFIEFFEDENSRTAILKFKEELNVSFEKQSLVIAIALFTEENNENFAIHAKKAFNLLSKNEAIGKSADELNNLQSKIIINLKLSKQAEFAKLNYNIEIIDSEYCDAIIRILKFGTDAEKEFVKKYLAMCAEMNLSGNANINKRKKLLDKMLKSEKKSFSPTAIQHIDKIRKEYILLINKNIEIAKVYDKEQKALNTKTKPVKISSPKAKKVEKKKETIKKAKEAAKKSPLALYYVPPMNFKNNTRILQTNRVIIFKSPFKQSVVFAQVYMKKVKYVEKEVTLTH